MIFITKITDRHEKYTAVDAFSSYDLATEFMDKWIATLSVDDLRHHDFSIERLVIDNPSYPFLKKV